MIIQQLLCWQNRHFSSLYGAVHAYVPAQVCYDYDHRYTLYRWEPSPAAA